MNCLEEASGEWLVASGRKASGKWLVVSGELFNLSTFQL